MIPEQSTSPSIPNKIRWLCDELYSANPFIESHPRRFRNHHHYTDKSHPILANFAFLYPEQTSKPGPTVLAQALVIFTLTGHFLAVEPELLGTGVLGTVLDGFEVEPVAPVLEVEGSTVVVVGPEVARLKGLVG